MKQSELFLELKRLIFIIISNKMAEDFVTIKIRDYLPALISSRQAAKLLTKESLERLSEQDKKKVALNFEEVEFVSRSFVDELLDSIEKFKNRGLEVEVDNANSPISQMLELVRNSRAQVK